MSKQIRKWIKENKNKNTNLLETTNIKENSYAYGNASANDDSLLSASAERNNFMKIVQRLSVRLGEKAAKYRPLIMYVSKNPKMLPLLEELIEQASTMQASKAKQIFK